MRSLLLNILILSNHVKSHVKLSSAETIQSSSKVQWGMAHDGKRPLVLSKKATANEVLKY